MNVNSSNITAEEVLMLTTRLSNAERLRLLRLLTSEISLIKTEVGNIQGGSSEISLIKTEVGNIQGGSSEISLIKTEVGIQGGSGTNIRQFSTSVSENDGPNTSTSNGIPTAKKSRRDNCIKEEEDDYVVVYTIGSCKIDAFRKAKAGVGVWFGPDHPLNISKPLGGVATRNRAEIHACIQAITTARQNGITKLKIKTRSPFVISTTTSWIHNWKNSNWKTANGTDVKNKGALVKLDKVCQRFDVKWEHVRDHVGVAEAEKLAVAGAVIINLE